MSITTVEIALERIAVAPKFSPIAIFKSKRKNRVEIYFASTVMSKKMMTENSKNLIGTFDKYCDMAHTREVLLAAIDENN
jgi:hypothetical protein